MKKGLSSKLTKIMDSDIVRRFFLIFTIISIVFFLILIPVLSYLQNTFAKLQLEKLNQKMNMGITHIEAIVESVKNASVTLSYDSRFTTLCYSDAEYTKVPSNIRNQLRNTFGGLMNPLEGIVSDAAVLLDQNVAILPDTVFFQDRLAYYPNCFQVDGLTYEEWSQLLQNNKSGFMPVHHIRTLTTEYDAIIYSLKWYNSTYIYVCLNVSDIKNLLVEPSDDSNCFITLSQGNETLLYSDLPENMDSYQTLSGQLSSGNLKITLYISDSLFYQKMQPVYFFLIFYCVVCVLLLILIIVTGTHVSARPFLGIISILENCRNIFDEDVKSRDRKTQNDFEYISKSIMNADQHLEQYQLLIQNQQKTLQIRFMERALTGQLTYPKDLALFDSYFPDFPREGYYLLLIRLQTRKDTEQVSISEPVLILQSFLQSELPTAYLQQLSESELLLLISEKDFADYRSALDYVINNINSEEPSLIIRCVASKLCTHFENLPAAYRQVQNIIDLPFTNGETQVCTADDFTETPTTSFSANEIMTLYTAISYGNQEMALSCLRTFSDELDKMHNPAMHRNVYEMIRTILTCIKLEHPLQLMDQYIPNYDAAKKTHDEKTLYEQLSEPISRFIEEIKANPCTEIDPFVQNIILYIDANYTSYDLCPATIAEHFECSTSTIRKVFKNATNMTVADYIEKKRMGHANEQLAQMQKTVTEIATECGYANLNSFYKAYKRVYGHAPTLQPKEPE